MSKELSNNDVNRIAASMLEQIENKQTGYKVRGIINGNFHLLNKDLETRATKDDVDKLKLRYYETEAALKADQPSPNIGDRALVGVPHPGTVWGCKTKGVWYNTGVAPTPEELNLTEYAKNGGSANDIMDLSQAYKDVHVVHQVSRTKAVAAIGRSIKSLHIEILDETFYYKLISSKWEAKIRYSQYVNLGNPSVSLEFQFHVLFEDGSDRRIDFRFQKDGSLLYPLVSEVKTSVMHGILELDKGYIDTITSGWYYLITQNPQGYIYLNGILDRAISAYDAVEKSLLKYSVIGQDKTQLFAHVDTKVLDKSLNTLNPVLAIQDVQFIIPPTGLPEEIEEYFTNKWKMYISYMNVNNYNLASGSVSVTGNVNIRNSINELGRYTFEYTGHVKSNICIFRGYTTIEGVKVYSGFNLKIFFKDEYFKENGNLVFSDTTSGLELSLIPLYEYMSSLSPEFSDLLIPNDHALKLDKSILLDIDKTIYNTGSGHRCFLSSEGNLTDGTPLIEFDNATPQIAAGSTYYRTPMSNYYSSESEGVNDITFDILDSHLILSAKYGLRYNAGLMSIDSADSNMSIKNNRTVHLTGIGEVKVYYDFPNWLLDHVLVDDYQYPPRVLAYRNSNYYTVEYAANNTSTSYIFKYILDMSDPYLKDVYEVILGKIRTHLDTIIPMEVLGVTKDVRLYDIIDRVSMTHWGWWGEGLYRATGWKDNAPYNAYDDVFTETSEDLIDYAEMFKDIFDNKHILAATNGMWGTVENSLLTDYHLFLLAKENNFGFFVDNFGGDNRGRRFMGDKGTELFKNRYKTAPIVLETYQMRMTKDSKYIPYYAVNDMELYYRAVSLNPSNVNNIWNYPTNRHDMYSDEISVNSFKRAFSYMGYRLVKWGSLAIKEGNSLYLRTNLKNLGITPIYEDYWQVQFIIRGDDGVILETIDSDFDIRTVEADLWNLTTENSKVIEVTRVGVSYTKGDVYIKIIDKKGLSKPFNLAHNNKTDNDEYFLTKFSI